MYEDPSGHAGLLNKITSAVKSAASSVAKTVTKAATTVTNTVKSVANTVSTAVKSAVNTVTTTVKKAATTVVNTVKSAASTVKNTATTVVNKVTSTAKTVVNNVKSTVSNAVSTVKNTVSTVYNNVSQAYTNVINDYGSIGNFVVSEVSNAYVAVKNCVVNLGDKAEVKVKAVWSDTKAFVKDSYDLAVQGYQSVSQKVQEANQWWKDNVSEPFKSTVKENFIEPIKEMKESAKAFVNEAKYELTNTFDNIKESISNGFNTAMEWCCEHSEIFSGMYDSIKGMTLAGMGAAMMQFGGAAISTGVWPVMITGAVSLIAGAGCLCFGAADTGEGIIEIINGSFGLNLPNYNAMKDTLFGGDQIAYDSAEMSVVFAGYTGAAIGQWLMPSSSGGQNIAKNAGYDNSQGSAKTDFYVTPEGSVIPQSMYHSLSDSDARRWYLEQEARIPDLIDYKQSLEQQAYQAFTLRNQFRTTARELMADRNKAEALYITDPNRTWNQIINRQIEKGLTGDDIYRAIIESSQRSRTSVNKLFGLE